MKDNRKIWIYTLSDPRDGLVKYVGKTFRPKRRLREHLVELSGNTKKVNWIKSLKKKGLNPIFEKLEETDIENCDSLEIYWIAQFRMWGFDLKNHTDGGDGSYGVEPWNKGLKGVFKHSEESKKKMSESRKGKCDGKRNGFYGKKHSDENKKKWSEERKKKRWSEDYKESIRGFNSPNCKKVYCYDLESNLIKIYDFGRQVIEDGFDWNQVSKVCRGVQKTHKKHRFSYDELK